MAKDTVIDVVLLHEASHQASHSAPEKYIGPACSGSEATEHRRAKGSLAVGI